ncbi:Transposase [Hordeum vulgare]|nr:Transposase [Hordeum vulgare]
MVNKLLPTIKALWPASEHGRTIYTQQDNGKTYISVNDCVFSAAAHADGWDNRLRCQPPKSPHVNILDLGFFATLQALFEKMSLGKIDDIVVKVQKAYDMYPAERSNHIFLTLQSCMHEVLKKKGGNRYKIPHMRKSFLAALELLSDILPCDTDVVVAAIEALPDA